MTISALAGAVVWAAAFSPAAPLARPLARPISSRMLTQRNYHAAMLLPMGVASRAALTSTVVSTVVAVRQVRQRKKAEAEAESVIGDLNLAAETFRIALSNAELQLEERIAVSKQLEAELLVAKAEVKAAVGAKNKVEYALEQEKRAIKRERKKLEEESRLRREAEAARDEFKQKETEASGDDSRKGS